MALVERAVLVPPPPTRPCATGEVRAWGNRKAAGREVVPHISRVQAAPLAPRKHW